MLLDAFEHVRPTPMQKTLPPYLMQAEVRAILEVCDPETQLRDRAVLEVLYSYREHYAYPRKRHPKNEKEPQ